MKTLQDLHKQGYKILISMEKEVDTNNSTMSLQDIIDMPSVIGRLSHVQESGTTRYSLLDAENKYIVENGVLDDLIMALKELR